MSWPKAILLALLLFGGVCVPVAYLTVQFAAGPSLPAAGSQTPLTVVSSPSGLQFIQVGVYVMPTGSCMSVVGHYGETGWFGPMTVMYQRGCVAPQPAVEWFG